ncbi:hypothetical protein Q4555_12595 [Octadecabacter sp. 1_MG-2023]|uniref:hypothetical protein n=1 Tax=unclassified Octadecabacter TaxID=196158 RepID=UPI001C09C6A2|nr:MULTISPECIES: hypothetical protein [unclassified Octadecabacter]MBU2993645.1 hypothetical protein [Octadecabacter sp. B2R22]MDO6735511.1 hypothetical protein [Octadecabacter sp. 1_MG-2023]
MAKGDALDPKGLMEEAFKIEGISAPECRSIFLDWALSYHGAPHDGIKALLERHAAEPADHPMTKTLNEGLVAPTTPKRRGGRQARVAD